MDSTSEATSDSDSDSPTPRLVMIHGFTQTSRCWAPLDGALAGRGPLMLDAPGHGRAAGLRLGLYDGAVEIASRGGRATYLGYSMGGRLCLHAALARPELVERLVLVSTTAGIDDDRERAARRRADEALADHIVDVGVERFVDEWLAQPLFAGLSDLRAHRRERLANTAEGLASSLRLAGTGTQSPLWERLADLSMPVLVIAGEHDARFVGLAERLAAAVGANAEVVTVAGAGHSAHLEQPEAFVRILGSWLDRTGGG